jgi:hypothetical protein
MPYKPAKTRPRNPTAPAKAPIFIGVAAPVYAGGAGGAGGTAGPVGVAGTTITDWTVVGFPCLSVLTIVCVVVIFTGTVVVAFSAGVVVIAKVLFIAGGGGAGGVEGLTGGVLVETMMLEGLLGGGMTPLHTPDWKVMY